MNSDVLTISVPLASRYPSVNHLGRDGVRAGRKTPEYHALFAAVKEAAEREIVRTGWTTAHDCVDTSVVLYRTTQRWQDPQNIGKVELDSLTAAKVWADDHLAKPWHTDIEYDPNGPDRVVIILRRRFTISVAKPHPIIVEARKNKAKVVDVKCITPRELMGEVNGVPTPRSEILRQLQAGKLR